MDRKTYEKESINVKEQTNYLCSVCKRGYLLSKDENISLVDYRTYNAKISTLQDFEDDWLKHSFNGKFVCSNSMCLEEFSFAGKTVGNYISGEYSTPYGMEDFEGVETHLFIEYIDRSPQIIPIRDEYPEKLNSILESSFQLFWIDLNSCANRIRVYLESLMDLNQIASKDAGGNYRSLNARLKEFCSKGNQYLNKYLHSIRWIGNHASHQVTLKRCDILDIYQILEYILLKLYVPNEEKMLGKIADEINKNTGPRGN